ncbi:hypothetical protein BHE74_00056507, partial [Ensete ventricosum]
TVVKQSINLARGRGHAQVTPLHVANTMLSSSIGLLRAACLRCHSHPLQCKALELCFNVALNRLPASTLSAPALVKNEDVVSVVQTLATRRKRSLVIVGECLATTEAVVGGVMDRVNKGEVPDVLRNVRFIPLPLFSFIHMPLQEVNHKVGELRCLVKSCCCVERGAVLYLKDLNWAAEYRASGEKGRNRYCPLEHATMEIRNMLCEGENSGGRLWLMGSATYQTYIRCRVGNPSLETLWGLQPHTIPTGSLGLSLKCDRY